jgi:microcystin-dependent protein
MSPKLFAVTAGAVLATVAALGALHVAPSSAQLPAHAHAAMHRDAPAAMPTLPGQDAFGAIQEIVQILQADPATDWSKVNLAALREHLVDMNEVTLRAVATESPVDGGVAIAVTGSGRTLEGIRRMIPAHGQELNRLNGWRATTEALPDGVRLTVTSSDPAQMVRLRALGFAGLLVSGAHHAHHQPHHLMMARGEHVH